MNTEEIQQKIDEQIDHTLNELKIDALDHIITALNKEQNIDTFILEIYTHEKHMRRDYFYDAQQTFDNAFFAEIIINNHKTIDLKEALQKAFMFGMKYRPTTFNMDFYIASDKYDVNKMVNQFVSGGFFKEAIPQLFPQIVEAFAVKGIEVSAYKEEAPKEELKNSYSLNDTAKEAKYLQNLLQQSTHINSTKNKM